MFVFLVRECACGLLVSCLSDFEVVDESCWCGVVNRRSWFLFVLFADEFSVSLP